MSFPATPLRRAVVTGNPVRPEVLAIDRARDAVGARAKLDVEPGRRVVLIFGGSLGALRINRAAVDAARRWAGRGDLHVRHIVGARDWDEITAGGPPVPPPIPPLPIPPIRATAATFGGTGRSSAAPRLT